MKPPPSRGDIWLVSLEPVEGREQGGTRPCLILSDNLFNQGPAELAVVLPLTSKQHDIPLRVPVISPVGGVRVPSFIMPEMIRSISTKRLHTFWGSVDAQTMATVETHIRILLKL